MQLVATMKSLAAMLRRQEKGGKRKNQPLLTKKNILQAFRQAAQAQINTGSISPVAPAMDSPSPKKKKQTKA